MADISSIDKNLKVETKFDLPDVKLYDVRQEPFDLYGFYHAKKEPAFCRLPEDVAKATNEGVAYLATNTAGGRVRFATDSQYVALKAIMPGASFMPHMPICGSTGFDIYEIKEDRTDYVGTFMPPTDIKEGYESVARFGSRRMRQLMIHFPLYAPVKDLYLGFQEDAKVEHGAPYKDIKPIVYYGSSITQGGCASKPGDAYQSMISAKRNIDHINLGFSGSARGEQVMAEYIAKLDMSIFVMDYDHNAPNVEHLQNTHWPFYRTIREKNPDLPILMISMPSMYPDIEEDTKRRAVIRGSYERALAEGDKNVAFLDGGTLFDGSFDRNACTVDRCHPTSLGFERMAYHIDAALAPWLDK